MHTRLLTVHRNMVWVRCGYGGGPNKKNPRAPKKSCSALPPLHLQGPMARPSARMGDQKITPSQQKTLNS